MSFSKFHAFIPMIHLCSPLLIHESPSLNTKQPPKANSSLANQTILIPSLLHPPQLHPIPPHTHTNCKPIRIAHSLSTHNPLPSPRNHTRRTGQSARTRSLRRVLLALEFDLWLTLLSYQIRSAPHFPNSSPNLLSTWRTAGEEGRKGGEKGDRE